jgi:hypothetical protein
MAGLRNNTTSIPLDRIKVDKRHRHDLGDVATLADSIIVTTMKILGAHRLSAGDDFTHAATIN